MKNNECTVLVCSCDKYADLLEPFSQLWEKYWPDCPFETVLVTETALSQSLCFNRILACGKGGNWCDRLLLALDQIHTPYVLMLCDDYYLSHTVDTDLILRRLSQIKEVDGGNLRMIPNPLPKKSNSRPFRDGTDLMCYKPMTAYCIATQAGLWNVEFLKSLAKGKASIWEFERYGSFDPIIRAKPLLVTPTKEFPFIDAVHKGCWEDFGVKCIKDNGIVYDFSKRGRPSLWGRIREGLKAIIFAVAPVTLLVRLQNMLGAGAKERS